MVLSFWNLLSLTSFRSKTKTVWIRGTQFAVKNYDMKHVEDLNDILGFFNGRKMFCIREKNDRTFGSKVYENIWQRKKVLMPQEFMLQNKGRNKHIWDKNRKIHFELLEKVKNRILRKTSMISESLLMQLITRWVFASYQNVVLWKSIQSSTLLPFNKINGLTCGCH